jgi:hypothetical protein
MSSESIQQATLMRASVLAGGVKKLGSFLKLPATDLSKWIEGTQMVPTWVFLRAVDYVNQAEAAGLSSMPRPDPSPRESEES